MVPLQGLEVRSFESTFSASTGLSSLENSLIFGALCLPCAASVCSLGSSRRLKSSFFERTIFSVLSIVSSSRLGVVRYLMVRCWGSSCFLQTSSVSISSIISYFFLLTLYVLL